MKKVLLIALIGLVLFFSGCVNEEQERQEVLDRFDGYEWSWNCWSQEHKYILYKSGIESVEKEGNYWVIKGSSEPQFNDYLGEYERAITEGEVENIIIVYDKENDKITEWYHGEVIYTHVGEDGKLKGSPYAIAIEYC